MNRIRKKMHEVKRASRHVQFKDKQCLAIILATVVMFAVSALTVFEAIGLAARYGHLPVLSALSLNPCCLLAPQYCFGTLWEAL